MEIKTYTKKDIAKEFSRRSQNSTRASIKLTDHFFNILKDILIEALQDRALVWRSCAGGTFPRRPADHYISKISCIVSVSGLVEAVGRWGSSTFRREYEKGRRLAVTFPDIPAHNFTPSHQA